MFKQLKIQDKHTKCNYCNYMGCSWSIDKHGPVLGHWIWTIRLYSGKVDPIKAYRRLVKHLTRLDYSKVTDIQVEGIDHSDCPDYCDAFISSASYKGKPMTDKQLDRLNEDSAFVYQAIHDTLY